MTAIRPALCALAAMLPLAGCATDSLARRDTVTAFSPDTQRQVIAAQAVNPWPREAYDKTWTTSGARALDAQKRARAAAGTILVPVASTTGG